MADSDTFTEASKWDVMKKGPVSCSGKLMTLLLSKNGLSLKDDKPSGAKKIKGLELHWCDVLTAQPSKKFKGSDEKKGFCLHYMELQSNKKLQCKKMDILSCEESADVWIDTILSQCASVTGRPKRLFVIVNPIGGSQSSQQVYEKKVRPIFELAQIHADVHVTERAKHALEMGENQDFSSYDGIVVLGGDGTYHEVLEGLTIQTQKAAGVNYHDRNEKLKALSKPIGVVPTGTGNGVAAWLNGGVIDVETAVLRVLRGEQHLATILSVHSNGQLFAICGLLIAYGFFSDLIKRTDELRWMKRARYPYCLLASMFGKPRGWHCDLEYRLAPGPSCEERSGATGDVAQSAEMSESKWVKHDSKSREYKGVSAFIANIERIDEKVYVDPFSDRVSLLVDHGCSVYSLFKFLYKYWTGKDSEPLPSNLEVIRNVQGFRLKVKKDVAGSDENLSGAKARARELEQYLDLDGEVKKLEVLEFEMSLIPSFAPVYGIHQAGVLTT